ncbi:hypothetical protein LshimejAT787_1105580 [Lyophyllum shimeji]|uniref:Uncharacterized protein n=1 Tax=Lyophyllum shimeji TaxID=47721 RepID=A0A9P3PVV9_LYOSH|nr:hypothetical protein LshimejAT787_1105580 [Lyophyllum shimeji]
MDTMSLSNPTSHLPRNTDNPAIPDQIVPPVPTRPHEYRDHRAFYARVRGSPSVAHHLLRAERPSHQEQPPRQDGPDLNLSRAEAASRIVGNQGAPDRAGPA